MYGPVSLATADVVTGEKSERTSWRLRVHRDDEDSGPDRLFRVSKREIERERERERGGVAVVMGGNMERTEALGAALLQRR